MTTDAITQAVGCLRLAALRRDGAGLTDGELLGLYARRRDEAAFAALLRRHGPMVLGVCRRVLRNEADAEDAFQATFLVLVRKADAIHTRATVGNWLYGVAHNTARKARALNRKRLARELAAGAVPKPGPGGDWDHLLPLLDAELGRLPDAYRTAVVLCDLEGRTIKEAARQLGWPQGTAATRLARGRALLARRLARHAPALAAAVVAGALAPGVSAGVPPGLQVTTYQAATAGTFPARVAALAERVLTMMRLSKLKVVVAAVLALAALGLAGRALVPGAPAAPATPTPVAGGAARKAVPQQPQEGFFLYDSDGVEAAAFAPDGKLLAGGCMDGKVRLWDTKTNQLRQTLDGPKGPVRTVAFSPDGKLLAAGADDGAVHLWDVAGGKLQKTLPGDGPAFVNGLVFLSHTRLAVAVNRDEPAANGRGPRKCRIQLWDLPKDTCQTLYAQPGSAYCLARSADGGVLAAALNADEAPGGFHGLKVWDLGTEKLAWEHAAGTEFMTAVAFAPDGKSLAVGGGVAIEVESNGRRGFRSEGRLWCFAADTHQILWHTADEVNGTYSAIAFTPDGKGVLTGSSGPIRDYELNGAKGSKVLSELRRWDAATGKPGWRSEGALGHLGALAASPDGTTLAGGDSEQFMVFDPDTGLMREVLMKRTLTPRPRPER